MKSFEEISKMNLAELDRPAGAGEEELETETTGAAVNHSVSDAEEAGTCLLYTSDAADDCIRV